MTTTVVEISDTEDSDDCVIKSVVFVVEDKPESDLYREVCKENQLLADFIEKCISLDNSEDMLKVLKENLLTHYYAADKRTRESSKFQKNLRRANHLLKTNPFHKFSHIKDLCDILKASIVKKRVPFVTLGTNIIDTNSKSNELKRCNNEQLNRINGVSKKPKLDSYSNFLFSESTSANFNDTYDALDESMSMETCSQRTFPEVDELLISNQHAPVVPTAMEKKLKVIESKIAYYKRTIETLDELEVDDDSVNSPYIKSERLKLKIVSLYKERCQLLGTLPVKRKGIRLKLAEGHPPGPTKALERFLNKNCNKDGDPPFPDFCDVITCVTEANDKEGLEWNKQQIMNEASTLFTLCGRALQKRRQNREYHDLIYKVKLDELEKDPADDDPELKAKLEENKRIAVKKESDILERYTMMQYLPRKPKPKNNITLIANPGNKNICDIEPDVRKEHIHENNIVMERLASSIQVCEKGGGIEKSSDTNNMNASKCNSDVERHECQDTLHSTRHENLDGFEFKLDDKNEKSVSAVTSEHNVETKIEALDCSSDAIDGINNTIHNSLVSNGAGLTVSKFNNKKQVHNNISNIGNEFEINNLDVIKNEISQVEAIECQVSKTDTVELFKKLGSSFTVSIEIVDDN